MARFNSIGTKIFAIAIGLVALMLIVSAASLYMVNQVRRELEVQAQIFVPLSNELATVEATVLEGEVLVERLRVALDEGRVHLTPKEIHAEIRTIGDEVIAAFDRAEALVADIDLQSVSQSSAITATRVVAGIEQVERRFRDYQARMERLLVAHESGEVAAMDLLDSLLAEDERAMYDTLNRLRDDLAAYVDAALAHVVRLDRILDWLIITLTSAAALLGLALSALLTRHIVRPIRQLVGALKQIEAGDLDTQLRIDSRDETASMADGFNHMVQGLRAKQRITETFGKYVDPRVVDSLIGNPALTKPGGDRRHMTVLFADMRGFTGLSERLTPDALVTLINAYLEDMSTPIKDSDGVIDKFIGDAIMAYWGPPFVDPTRQAQMACEAALRQLELIEAFKGRLTDILGVKLEKDLIDIHSGIASGEALVGTVGSSHHRNYTIMGDTVNLAARIEGSCTLYGVRLLVDEATRAETKNILFREIDAIRVKGRREPVRIFEPLTVEPAAEAKRRLAERFEAGLTAYRARDGHAARAAFAACLEIAPDDGPARLFLDRLEEMDVAPPPADWDGVYVARSK